MRKFLERAVEKASKMNEDSMRSLLRVLADENDRLDAVMDSMMTGIVVCDESHIPILINKAAERLLPLSPVNLFDAPFWESIRDAEAAAFVASTLKANETILDREFAFDASSGSRILSLSIAALIRAGKIRGSIIHIDDTTDLRRKEARLRRAESLASLTTLAAGVAHEIKNPLGAISIHVQLLRKTTAQCGSDHTMRYLDVINEEIDRLNKIVVDFLFAVRPIDIQTINGDINALVREVSEFMRVEANKAHIRVETEYDVNMPLIPFDKRYMKQALLNLIKNAIAAMETTQGQKKLRIGTTYESDEAKLRIEDTGTGIAEDKLEKIFEPYYTTKENGTGLGLTLTYKIIKEHGGDISVRSKEGHGSVFTVTLPIPQKDKKMISGFSPVDSECCEVRV